MPGMPARAVVNFDVGSLMRHYRGRWYHRNLAARRHEQKSCYLPATAAVRDEKTLSNVPARYVRNHATTWLPLLNRCYGNK